MKDDLVGDGWQVLKHEVARQVDSATSGDAYRMTNGANIAKIKSVIRNDYNQNTANTKAILIVGHVAVPYAGELPDDGHEDHYGTWAADIYYGDIDGTWNDNIQRTLGPPPNNLNLIYAENLNYGGDRLGS